MSKLVSFSSFLMLLRNVSFFRSVSKVNDEWFADEERVRRTVGILEGPVVTTPDGREVIPLILDSELFSIILAW